MTKYHFRRALFAAYSYFISACRIILGKSNKGFQYHRSFFTFIRVFKKTFHYNYLQNKVFYHPVYSGLGWNLYLKGSFEEKELEICRNFIRTDSVVLDIGANIGIHSLFYSSLAKQGKVYAFEPSLFTFEYLIKNVRNSPNIIPMNIGLFSKSGLMEFYECENDALSGLKDTKRSNIKAKTSIICLRGDDWANLLSPSKIDFIKIDVEGLEQEVIEGFQSLIVKFHPVLFIEIYQGENSNPEPEKTIKYIENLGYKAMVVDAEGALKNFKNHSDREYSYFFIPK
jgi:FkbM family methyltransferase